MKRIKLLFLWIFSSVFLYGQEYVPLLDTSKTWNIYENWIYWGETYPHYLEVCETDSARYVIKKEWHSEHITDLGYLFEDTASKKVYYTDMYNNEVLLYDFSLVEGDVFQYNLVTNVDSIPLLDGSYRKRIIFEDGYYSWIEGIGSIQGGLLWSDWHFKKHIPEAWMLCYYENDSLLLTNDDYDTCNVSFLNNIAESSDNLFSPTVYPNPFNKELSISFDNPIHGEKLTISVLTLDGREIFNETLHSDFSLDLSFLPKGIYLLVLTNKDFRYTAKIVKL
ncbi:MAG: T9SS C-terminal target domain-containing protein [Bacteroidetes bacterium]|nr:MAG: T9SS C-terminal target domain-containing protein [Bacteroidota bacterium]